MSDARKKQILLERSIPEPNSGCWLWHARCDVQGYGRFQMGLETLRAHRVSWELHHGRAVPPGLVICHKCDVRACVNPAHLFLGSVADNNADARSKGRAISPTGERHGSNKITAAQALAAYSDARPLSVIARELGIRVQSVADIKRGKNWRSVTRHEPGSYPARNVSESLEGVSLHAHNMERTNGEIAASEYVTPRRGA